MSRARNTFEKLRLIQRATKKKAPPITGSASSGSILTSQPSSSSVSKGKSKTGVNPKVAKDTGVKPGRAAAKKADETIAAGAPVRGKLTPFGKGVATGLGVSGAGLIGTGVLVGMARKRRQPQFESVQEARASDKFQQAAKAEAKRTGAKVTGGVPAGGAFPKAEAAPQQAASQPTVQATKRAKVKVNVTTPPVNVTQQVVKRQFTRPQLAGLAALALGGTFLGSRALSKPKKQEINLRFRGSPLKIKRGKLKKRKPRRGQFGFRGRQ